MAGAGHGTGSQTDGSTSSGEPYVGARERAWPRWAAIVESYDHYYGSLSMTFFAGFFRHGPVTGCEPSAEPARSYCRTARWSRSWRSDRIGSASSMAAKAADQSAGPYPVPRSP